VTLGVKGGKKEAGSNLVLAKGKKRRVGANHLFLRRVGKKKTVQGKRPDGQIPQLTRPRRGSG